MIAHIVLFNPKAALTSEQIRAFAQSVIDVCRAIPSVKRAALGRAIDVDPGYVRNFGGKTYQFSAVLEFQTADDLVAYLRHPQHEALGRAFWEHCETTIIVETQFAEAKDQNCVDILTT